MQMASFEEKGHVETIIILVQLFFLFICTNRIKETIKREMKAWCLSAEKKSTSILYLSLDLS